MNLPKIEQVVCNNLYISSEDLFKKTRVLEIIGKRQIFHFLARKYTKETTTTIAKYKGDFNHTTVLHSCETVKNLMFSDKKYKEKVTELMSILSEIATDKSLEKDKKYLINRIEKCETRRKLNKLLISKVVL